MGHDRYFLENMVVLHDNEFAKKDIIVVEAQVASKLKR